MEPKRIGPLMAGAAIALMGLAGGAVPAAAQEVLPWAGKPLAPPDETATGGDLAATEAAAAQCAPLFEAACRDLKTCAWIADVALEDGTLVPARCVARPPAPPKKAAKKPPPAKPKETTAAPEAQGAAPAVKASVARGEPEGEEVPAPAAKAEKAPAAAVIEAAAPEAPPAVDNAEPKVPAKAANAEAAPAQSEKTAEPAKTPIVVTPPPANSGPAMPSPSFGAINPVMPGGGAIVTTTVPPKE